jgi:hypothetical protein
MKRRVAWIVVACLCIAIPLVWRLVTGTEELAPASEPQPSVMEIASVETANPVPLRTTNTAATNPSFTLLRAQPNVATMPPSPPPTPRSSPDLAVASVVGGNDETIISTQTMPRVSSSDARHLPINPLTGEPEREIIGIGAVLAKDENGLRVRDVLPGSPAALANLSGCVIKSVDGVNVSEISMNECVQLIRGFEGSTVKLEILDPAQQRQTIEIVRNKVRL